MIKLSYLIMVACLATASVSAYANTEESPSFFERLFGSDEKKPTGPPPEVTLEAPFPTTPDKSAQSSSKLMDIYNTSADNAVSSLSIDQPHRSPKQISDWATDIVAQAMTIHVKTRETDFKKISSHFTPYAIQEYNQYLDKTKLIDSLSSNSYRLQAISNEEGIVIKEGAITGTYHWLVQIPLMTSFYKESQQEVEKSANIQSQNLIVQVQVGRIQQKATNDIGLVIERWQVSGGSQ